MSEFDLLFAGVWQGVTPAQVLADFILERVDDGELMASYLYLNEDRSDPDWAYLMVRAEEGRVVGELRIRNWEHEYEWAFKRDKFAQQFPEWLADMIWRIDRVTQDLLD